ncbi:MAG: hypothetical protein ACREMN_08585 [Gemmatimonadales bacterium]
MIQNLLRATRGLAFLLLVLQALGGGAVTLAHARDVIEVPAALEAAHDSRCPILHDGPRCALCQYAGARVVAPTPMRFEEPHAGPARVVSVRRAGVAIAAASRTPPSRAPPSRIS